MKKKVREKLKFHPVNRHKQTTVNRENCQISSFSPLNWSRMTSILVIKSLKTDISTALMILKVRPIWPKTRQKLFLWRGLGYQIWSFENKCTFKKCCWLHSFLAMEAKSRNQKDIWNCWPCFSPAPIFCQTVNPISTKGSWTPNLMF